MSTVPSQSNGTVSSDLVCALLHRREKKIFSDIIMINFEMIFSHGHYIMKIFALQLDYITYK